METSGIRPFGNGGLRYKLTQLIHNFKSRRLNPVLGVPNLNKNVKGSFWKWGERRRGKEKINSCYQTTTWDNTIQVFYSGPRGLEENSNGHLQKSLVSHLIPHYQLNWAKASTTTLGWTFVFFWEHTKPFSINYQWNKYPTDTFISSAVLPENGLTYLAHNRTKTKASLMRNDFSSQFSCLPFFKWKC